MRSATLKVRVGENGDVHKEGAGIRCVDDQGKDLTKFTKQDGTFEVPNTHYYRNAVMFGDLVVATSEDLTPPTPSAEVPALVHEEE